MYTYCSPLIFRSAIVKDAVAPAVVQPTVLLAYKKMENQVSDGKMASFRKVYDTLSHNEQKYGYVLSYLGCAICN